MNTFSESGKGSKVWWLELIKKHGRDGGSGHLQDVGLMQYAQTKAAIDDLVMTRLVNMVIKGQIAQPGSSTLGKAPRYELSTLGHRYLEEHKHEAAGDSEVKAAEEREEKSIVDTRRHSIPENPPMRKFPDEQKVPVSTSFERRVPAPDRAADTSLGKPVEKPKPTDVALREMDIPPAIGTRMPDGSIIGGRNALPVPRLADSPPSFTMSPVPKTWVEEFKEVLAEILIDEYAEKVTAKQILNYIDGEK